MSAFRPVNIPYLCTGNSHRSIMAEAITNRMGKGRFRAFSAGSRPAGKVAASTLELLIDLGYETAHLRSKNLQEFAQPGAPEMDLIVTVCDGAAGESCPVWPGHPAMAHWSIPDPARARGPAIRAALAEAYRMLEQRISALIELPGEALAGEQRQDHLRDIATHDIASARVWTH